MPTKWFAGYVRPPVAFCGRRNRQRITALGKAGAQHSKEVARVISNKFQNPAQTPSFGMSAYGPASLEVRAVAAITGIQVSTCALTRLGGEMGAVMAQGTFAGTSAWRPPTS
jgi:hypothetical protein